MTVVADAGPLIALAKLDLLWVLERLGEEVWVPVQVVHEVLAKPGSDAERLQAALDAWLKTAVNPRAILPEALEVRAVRLGAGEKAVIACALALPGAVWVLMDDASGRALARNAGLGVVGLAGLLIRARECRLILDVVPLLLDVRWRGYWIDDGLIDTVRRLTGE